MRIGLAGLGKMGSQVAIKLLAAGYEVVVDTRHAENTDPLVAKGAGSFTDYADLAKQLGDKPVVWLMIQHTFVPAEVDKLLAVLPGGSVIVDGGNSRFTSTQDQAEKCRSKGVAFVDVGTSGGVWGMQNGFSLMVGGEETAVDTLTPLFDALAEPKGAWHHFGPSGAGHFIKMVHNGIEYGVMQSFAEGYRVMREGPFAGLDLGKVAEVWQHGSINESFLNGLIGSMLKRDQDLKSVEGTVAESGEARWTLETAKEHSIPTPAIRAAFDVRLKSQTGDTNYATKFLAQLRNEFGGHAVNPGVANDNQPMRR